MDLLFFIFILLKKTKKSICGFVGLVLLIINSKVILKELLSLPKFTIAQIFYIHKLTEMIIFGTNENYVFAAFLVIASGLEGFDNI